jgi:hypothetical protein
MSGLTTIASANPHTLASALVLRVWSGMSPDFLSGLLFSIFVNNIQPKSVVIGLKHGGSNQ